jgi:hypothetical protein
MTEDVVLQVHIDIILDSSFACFEVLPRPYRCWNELLLLRREVTPVLILKVSPLCRSHAVWFIALRPLGVGGVVHSLELTSLLEVHTVHMVPLLRLLNPLETSRTLHIRVVHVVIAWESRVPVFGLGPLNVLVFIEHVVMDWASHVPFALRSWNVRHVNGVSNEPWNRLRGWKDWNSLSLSWSIVQLDLTLNSSIRLSSYCLIGIGVRMIKLHN